MDTINVRLFGRFGTSQAGTELSLEAHKTRELFCFLLLNRCRPHCRETLATLLWPDCSPAQSRAYLRKALWQLQATLESPSQAGPRLLCLDDSWVQINPDVDLWVDTAEFEQAYLAVQGVPGHGLNAGQVRRLAAAVDLYSGDLLEGWYQDWCLFDRERLQQIYLAMLDKLMGYHETQGAYEIASSYGARILRVDAAREHTHRRLMRLHYLAGDRTGAIRQYEQCAAILQRELAVPPDELTVALWRQICANKPDGLPDGPAPETAQTGALGISLTAIVARLKGFQELLENLQRQVLEDIEAFERFSH